MSHVVLRRKKDKLVLDLQGSREQQDMVIEELKAQVSTLTQERDAAHQEIARLQPWVGAYRESRTQIAAVEAQIAELRHYLNHRSYCAHWDYETEEFCTCGLNKVRQNHA